MTNPHEHAARLKKAGALLCTLLGVGVTAEQARLMDETHWSLAAKAARVNPPSAETIAIVIADLERVEKAKAA